NVREVVERRLVDNPNVHLIDPLGYEEFVFMMKRSYFIITDSGGVQEEAPSLGKPVLVLRDMTERPEALAAGAVELVGTSIEKIVSSARRLLYDRAHYLRMSQVANPYGDGQAAKRIREILEQHS